MLYTSLAVQNDSTPAVLEHAEDLLRAGITLRAALDERRGVVESRVALGLLLRRRGDRQAALVQFHIAERFYRAEGPPRDLAVTLHHIGAVHLDRGDHHVTLTWLERARAAFAELVVPDRYNAARVTADLGRVHLALHRHDDARAALVDAEGVFRALASRAELARVLSARADLARATGSPDEDALRAEASALRHVLHSAPVTTTASTPDLSARPTAGDPS